MPQIDIMLLDRSPGKKTFAFQNFQYDLRFLGMISATSRSSETQLYRQPQFDANKKVDECRYLSTLRTEKKSTSFFETVKNFCNTIWGWVKYNLLFCFFDLKEEIQNHLEEELKEYTDQYFNEAVCPNRRSEGKIIEAFNKLDPKLQKKIKNEICIILKKINSKLSEEKYKELLEQALKHPFIKFKKGSESGQSETKQENEQELRETIQVMGVALSPVMLELKGYPKE